MIRRYGRPPQSGQSYGVRHGAYAILLRGRKVLLAWQSEPYNELLLPGGGIDPGESPIRALHREVYEETGWRMTEPLRLGAFRRFTYMPDYKRHAEKICHIYLARPVRKLGPPLEPDHTPLWMDVEEAADRLTVSGDRDFARGVLRRLTLPPV